MIKERGRLDIDGVPLEVEWIGPPPGSEPTIVFLHHGLGCVATWRGFPRRMAAAAACGALVYSRAGHGGSGPRAKPWPADYQERDALEVLPRVLEAAGVREHVLFGHSDGGTIALISAARAAGEGLDGVVSVAAHVLRDAATYEGARAARRDYSEGNLRKLLFRFHGENTDDLFRGWSEAWLGPDLAGLNLEGDLRRIQVPVLAIQGDRDAHGTREQADTIARCAGGPCRVLTIEDCGHDPHREYPEVVVEATTRFLAEIWEPRRSTARDGPPPPQ